MSTSPDSTQTESDARAPSAELIAPLLLAIATPIVTVPVTAILMSALLLDGSDWNQQCKLVDVLEWEEHYLCDRGLVALSLLPGLVNLLPFVWLRHPDKAVRMAAGLAGGTGAIRFGVPVLLAALAPSGWNASTEDNPIFQHSYNSVAFSLVLWLIIGAVFTGFAVWQLSRPGGPMSWYFRALGHAADFSGRAHRTEFWMFFLFHFLSFLGLSLFSSMFSGSNLSSGSPIASWTILAVALALGLAVSVRRLHDTGRSGWWVLIGLVPLLGQAVLVVFLTEAGQQGDNRYGPDPKLVGSDHEIEPREVSG
jgi:uncharacterized membrane protein YhaH (DUF805 family)